MLQLRDPNIEPGQFWAKCEGNENDSVDDEDEERRGEFIIELIV